ncbi:MAG: calcium-translocating P-type ATPase, PMCA-type [Clostridia bacterium]|nr:calcium-translocating P-type ATPase, PMCA-type [Clostridia bacterium]
MNTTLSPQKTVGLTSHQAETSRKEHGDNRLTQQKSKSFLRHFFGNMADPVIRILLCALAVNLIMSLRGGDIMETIGIALSVFLATLISTLSERGSEAAFRRLSEECAKGEVRVYRDGTLRRLSTEELVCGDLILLGAGEQIPADGRIRKGSLRVDQAPLTGESREVKKAPSKDGRLTPDSSSAVFRGCLILSGEAEVEILAVGNHTMLGQISREICLETRESPLKIRLSRLAKQISRLGYVAALLVAMAYLFNTFVIDSGFRFPLILLKLKDLPYLGEHLLHAFLLGLTVIVMAVPEGLPMMIAVVLSANIRRMIRDRVLVRKPVGIEAAGSMNLLFTDKTGTLTAGKMRVDTILTADGAEYSDYTSLLRHAPTLARYYCLSCRYNTESILSDDGTVIGGNATERALLESVMDGSTASSPEPAIRGRVLFDSAAKFSAVSLGAPVNTILVKGAPDVLLPHVRYAMRADGQCIPFAPLWKPMQETIAERAARGERLLLLCRSEQLPVHASFGELTLLCAVSLCDPLRAEAPRAVRTLREAGVRVVMITGDHKATATHIAQACGIRTKTHSLVLNGDELARLSDHEVRELLPKLCAVSRALPSDKSRLVRIAQEAELVVGMTGDGINDAPALKRADIGFAMGSGTGVAKEAGDIIILDNNLASIARAVLYGRNIFKSIRKFITLQLTMNFCAVGVSMIGPFIGVDAPVTVVQMLWINIIMDTLGGLAFAGEAPLPSCMKEKPKKRDEPILNGYMIHQILLLGGFTVGLCIFFLRSPWVLSHFREAPDRIYHLTAFFALFIFTSVLNCFHARTDRLRLFSGLEQNLTFLAIMLAILVIQVCFIYLGGEVLRTAPLTLREALFTLSLSALVIPAELLRKLLWRLRGKKQGF